MIDDTLSWKSHVEKIVPTACYISRVVKPFLMQDVLKMIYYAYFHLVMTYGLLFWANCSHNVEVFRLKRKSLEL